VLAEQYKRDRGSGAAPAHRRIHNPDIRGRLDVKDGSVNYEVLQVGNGNALVWMERHHPDLPRTASGGFGWVEPLGHSLTESFDSATLRTRIERRLRAHLPPETLKTPVA
jgi:hypothetical protein